MFKGPCDRSTAHFKRKISERVDSKKNVLTAHEVFLSLTGDNPVRVRFVLIHASQIRQFREHQLMNVHLRKKRRNRLVSKESLLFSHLNSR